MQLTDEVVRGFEKARVFKDYGDKRVNSVDFHRSGDWLVASGDDDSLHIYDTQAGSTPKVVHSRKYGVGHARFTHSPQAIIHTSSKGNDHHVRYLSVHENNYLRYFRGHTQQVTSLCMSPSNDLFMSAAQDNQVRVWDLRVNQCQGLLLTPGPPCAEFDHQGLVFCVAIDSGIWKLYDARSFDKGPFSTFAIEAEARNPTPLTGLRFSLDGRLITAAAGGRLYLMDAYTGNTLFRFDTGCPEGAIPFQPTFTPDNQYLLSGCEDRVIRAWSCSTGALVANWEGHGERPTCLQWSPRKALAASGCRALALWLPSRSLLQDYSAAA